MKEIILQNKKHGMRTLLLCILVELLALAGIIGGAIMLENDMSAIGVPLFVVGFIVFCTAWIPLIGLRVLKPQEALVLTLFGKYIGTIKGEGFYAVNPFCVAVNPAATTKLNQSGDVASKTDLSATLNGQSIEIVDKRISLKIMTLNNNRQKINDCLGNPVEIGIAVMWKIVDTAKAAFNVEL